MAEITIVTAFFSIGRNAWKGFEKTDSDYFSYFKFWARMKNSLVVYVDSKEKAEKVFEIREGFGLKEKTECVVIEDIFQVDTELYESLKRVSEYERVSWYRLRPKNPESWNAEYNYIMLMKEWCVKDAVERGLAEGMTAWLDFGFNKNGMVYANREEFSFLWEYDFPEKINVFGFREEKEIPPIYEVIRDMTTFIQGGVIVAPATLWGELWKLVRKNMLFLNRLGFMDDDQTVLLSAWKEKPELFHFHYCDWILQLKEFGNPNLTLAEKKEKKLNIWKRLYILLHRMKNGKNPEIREFLKRQRESVEINRKKGYR